MHAFHIDKCIFYCGCMHACMREHILISPLVWQVMQSNIDGMMANYDQISAEREELLESLADV